MTGGMKRIAVLLVLSLLQNPALVNAREPDTVPGISPPTRMTVEEKVLRDVAYGEHELQRLDLYRPKGDSPMPVMVYVHGGGWRTGDKARVGEKARFFNERGWIFISINYRLVPDVVFPDNVLDVAKAITWISRNIAQQAGNPEQIFIMGHSAGAHLVSLVATNENYIEAAGSTMGTIKGVISLDTQGYDVARQVAEARSGIYEQAFGADPVLHRAASPQLHVEAGKDIPSFLICFSAGGQAQRTNPQRRESANEFARVLRKAGIDAMVIDASDRTHAEINQWFGNSNDTRVTATAWALLQDWLDQANGLTTRTVP